MADSIYGYRADDGAEVWESDVKELYREMLDACYSAVSVAGLEFDASRVVEELDPIAFRCGYLEHWDNLLEDGECVESLDDLEYSEGDE